MRTSLALAAALASAGCTSPDDSSGEMHLVVVQAPEAMTPGDREAQTVVVRVLNADENPVAGIPVTWRVASGGGTVRASSDTSGVDGLAAALWRGGITGGPQQLAVSIYDQPAVNISVQADVFHAEKLSTTFGRGCGLQARKVWCWGDDHPVRPIHQVMSQIEAYDIAASYSAACVLDAAGTAFCNLAFEPGDPEALSTIPGLPPLESIVGGGHTFCGIATADASPWCWGDRAMSPSQISASLALSQLSIGLWYGCGLDPVGAAWCWDLRIGSPTLVPGGHAFRSVSAHDEDYAACGIEQAEVWCWYTRETPLRVAQVSAGQVALGWPFALLNTGPVAAVADVQPIYEQTRLTLGMNVHEDRAFPLPVRQVYPSCVLTHDNATYCLAVDDVNAAVFPVRSYWKAIPAPPS